MPRTFVDLLHLSSLRDENSICISHFSKVHYMPRTSDPLWTYFIRRVFEMKILYAFLISPKYTTCPEHLILCGPTLFVESSRWKFYTHFSFLQSTLHAPNILSSVDLLHSSSLRDENSIRISNFSKVHYMPRTSDPPWTYFIRRVFQMKILYAFLISPKHTTCPEHLILCHLIILTLLCEQYDLFNSSTLFTHALAIYYLTYAFRRLFASTHAWQTAKTCTNSWTMQWIIATQPQSMQSRMFVNKILEH
jgi:hypothetical protein